MSNPCDRITEAELQILRALWAYGGPMTGNEIITRVSSSTAWNPSTIKTLIRRLQGKDALSVEQRNVMLYSARISEADFSEYQTARLIDSFYSGKVANLISALYDQKQIGPEDLEELRRRMEGGKGHE